MNKQDLIRLAECYIENAENNYVSKERAISDKTVGLKIFDYPIFAFGSADDEYFTLFKQPSIIGNHFLAPKEWIPRAKTVISFFCHILKK